MEVMNKNLFAQMVESMEQMGEVTRGEHTPPHKFHIDTEMEPANVNEEKCRL